MYTLLVWSLNESPNWAFGPFDTSEEALQYAKSHREFSEFSIMKIYPNNTPIECDKSGFITLPYS